MASSSDGLSLLPSMPDFSSTHHNLFSTAGDMKFHLQTLLDNKEKQLQQAATLGQRVLAQQMELDERIRQLQELDGEKTDDDQLDDLARERYRELADTLVAWDKENAQLSSAFGTSTKRSANGKDPSPSIAFAELPREEPERSRPSAGTSAAQSRRAKNAAHRADDVEFAFEIGSGLLTEVRRLQSLLGERDKAIQDMKEEKDDLEKTVESLRAALRQQEQSADKYKEENWNLEVTLQELRTQLSDSQSSTQRLESEHKRLTKLLSNARDTGDQHKNESERLANIIEEMKAKHETDIAQARRHAAGLARDKSDLQQTIDNLKKEAVRNERRLPRYGSPLTPNGGPGSEFLTTPVVSEDGTTDVFTGGASTRSRKLDPNAVFGGPDEFGDNLDSPEVSPVRQPFLSPNHPNNEIEALQQRLAHAQRQINTLKGTLQREKQLKMDYKNRLEASPGASPLLVEDEDVDEQEDDEDEDGRQKNKTRQITPFRVGGRGRGRGRGGRSGMTLIQRLGMAAASPASVYNDDDARSLGDSPAPPVPPIPIHFSPAEEDEEDDGLFRSHDGDATERVPSHQDDDEDLTRRESVLSVSQLSRSPSPNPLEPPSNRTSIDGMDPVFANVLKRRSSNGSTYSRSPLRQSVLTYSARRGRRSKGGVPYKKARPASLVAALDVLSAELSGMQGSPMRGQDLLEEVEVETAEMSCQTEEVQPEAREVVVDKEVVVEKVVEKEVVVEKVVEKEAVVENIVEKVKEVAVPVVEEKDTAEMGVQFEPELHLHLSSSLCLCLCLCPSQRPKRSPPPRAFEQAMQTEEVPTAPAPVYVETSTATDPEPQLEPVPAPVLVQAQTQTVQKEKVDPDIQTISVRQPAELGLGADLAARERRTTITQRDRILASISRTSSSSGTDTVIGGRRGPFLAETSMELDDEEEEDGNETETGAETETDTDDYQDARQSIGINTPSGTESRDDFHSIMTMTDNDIEETDEETEEDDDVESIRASARVDREDTASVGSSVQRRSSFYETVAVPPLEYEEVGVSANFKPEPEVRVVVEKVVERVVEIERVEVPVEVEVEVRVEVPAPLPPKPEVKEMSIQTDEWKMPVSPTQQQHPPSLTPGALYRIGSPSNQQFQFIAPPMPVSASVSATSTQSAPPPRLSNILRESSGPFPRSRPSSGGRKSMESVISSIAEDPPQRVRVPSTATMLNAVDKTKPPMMMLPPPPKAPPPPGTMAPPAFIPDRRMPTTSMGSYDMPPPRPSSPPPPELIQRATTPTFGSALSVPGQKGILRQGGSSMPPSSTGLRQPPSTSSFRSAANAAVYASQAPSGALPSFNVRERRDYSQTSLISERSVASPRSSISSDHHDHHHGYRSQPLPEPITPNKNADTTARPMGGPSGSTDPAVIHAITQTMIGEFMYKYTRKAIGKGYGERRHKRFFWVHPYTKTLYWSSADPGSTNVSESSAKSAYIEGVRSVLDPNPMPPGLYQYSVVVSTPQREMKITAPTKERHDIWVNALKYLLARPNPMNLTSPASAERVPPSPASQDFTDDERIRAPAFGTPQSQRSGRSMQGADSWNNTPRGQRSRSQLSMRASIKRSNTPAAEYLRWNGPESPYSPIKSFVDVPGGGQDEEDLDFELDGEAMSDDGYEGLENVRACCDGRHTVGHSGKHHHHHHHHHHSEGQQHFEPVNQHLEPVAREAIPTRPISPSAWSFRSRAGSTHSNDGGTGLFSWGRADGKLRFGSRRSTRTVPSQDQ